MVQSKVEMGCREIEYRYEYNDDSNVVTLPTSATETARTDAFGRLTEVAGPISIDEYSYFQEKDKATDLVNRVTRTLKNDTIERTRYIYDENSNITEIRDGFNRLVSKYEYDTLGRLVKDGETEFGYDTNGNILYKKTGENIIEYKYSGDLMDSYNGQACDYDDLGNPFLYRDKALKWSHVRNLDSYDNGRVRFRYDAAGTRISKTHDNHRSEYVYHDGQLLMERRMSLTSDLEVGDYMYEGESYYSTATKLFDIEYLYGVDGITGFRIDDAAYYYLKNLAGDITHIYHDDDS